MASFQWPPTGGSSNGVPAYANFAAFPASAADGSLAIALDTDILYAYNLGLASWVIIGGPGAALSIGTINSQTKSANGAVIAADSLIMQTADASFPGLMSIGTQTIAGAKTFSSAPTLSSLNSAGLVHTNSAGLLSTSLAVNADISASAAIAYSKLALTGSIVNADINATAAIAYSKLDLSSSIVNADISGSAAIAVNKLATLNSSVAVVTTAGGVLTSSATTSAEIGFVAGVTSAIQTQLNSKQATGAYITALTGDVTASGAGSAAATLAATSNATLTTLSALTTASSLVTVGTITGGTWAGTAVALNHGGTGQTSKAPAFDALQPMTTLGDIIYGGASGTGTRLGGNTATSTQLLSSVGSGGLATAPVWLTAASTATNSTVVLRDGSGNFAATTITAALTGTASGNTTYSANNHGVVLSSGTNAMTVIAPDSSVTKVLTSGGASADPTWAAVPFGNYAVTSQTTTYAILTTDNIVLCSGSAFTATLPTAVGVTGKTYTIKKTDSSFTNIITVATTSSQTINGSGTTYTLNTINEEIMVVSDGSNWQILDHTISSAPVTYTPTFTGFGTPAAQTVYYHREGAYLYVQFQVTVGTTTAVVASITLPSGLAINTTPINAFGHAGTFGASNTLFSGNMFVQTGTSTSLIYFSSASANWTNALNGNTWASPNQISGWFKVPISGWNG